jgi:hypothetical protein
MISLFKSILCRQKTSNNDKLGQKPSNSLPSLTKYDMINKIGQKFELSTYLEISSISTGFAFDHVDGMIFKNKDILYYSPDEIPDNFIEVLRKDIDIEPQSFEHHFKRIQEKQIKYDIVFVDSWHTYNQSLKDLETALYFVSKSGFIVIHDCCPEKEELIGEYTKNAWCGQTYEAFIDFSKTHDELEIFCVNSDYGCGVVAMEPTFLLKRIPFNYEKNKIKDWNYFEINKKELLNLIEADEFLSMLGAVSK